jgi:hypothetical protein
MQVIVEPEVPHTLCKICSDTFFSSYRHELLPTDVSSVMRPLADVILHITFHALNHLIPVNQKLICLSAEAWKGNPFRSHANTSNAWFALHRRTTTLVSTDPRKLG